MTLILLKPDAFEQKLDEQLRKDVEKEVGPIARSVRHNKECQQDYKEMFEAHYFEHEGKPFYSNLIQQMNRGQVVAMAIRGGEETIKRGRAFVEKVRAKYTVDKTNNTIHASDSVESFRREVLVWFPEADFNDVLQACRL